MDPNNLVYFIYKVKMNFTIELVHDLLQQFQTQLFFEKLGMKNDKNK